MADTTRQAFGLICLTPDFAKVALVRDAGTCAWKLPSAIGEKWRDAKARQALLDLAKQQLGLYIKAHLCAQPIIKVLCPEHPDTEAQVSTKFFLALNVPEVPLVPGDSQLAAHAASWEDLKGLLAGTTADQPAAGSQLASVLPHLQGLLNRRYELVLPVEGGTEDVAALLSWREGSPSWRGPSPKACLEQHCRDNKLPAPCFNVFEHHRSTAHSSANNRTTFSATALLPHTGLQLTPDAAYSSPSDAQQNAALLALLWLDGGLDPGCGLVHFAAAGEMAQVPNAFTPEHQLGLEGECEDVAAGAAAEADRAQRPQQHQHQQQHPRHQHQHLQQQQQQQPQQQHGGNGTGGTERPAKRSKTARAGLGIAQALQQMAPGKQPVMAIKELCDKCRLPPAQFQEGRCSDGGTTVTVTIQEGGVLRAACATAAGAKQAKAVAAAALLDRLRQLHLGAGSWG